MKRDFELIRKILIEIEKIPFNKIINGISIESYTNESILEHTLLLTEAKLIKASACWGDDQVSFIYSGLTWEGHDFLDKARNDVVWKKALNYITNKGGGITLPILSTVLSKFITEHLEI